MKKSILFWIGVLVVTLSTGLSSCNTDGESDFNTGNVNYESNPINLNGTWHMVSASFGFGGTVEYRASEKSVTFDEATKTMAANATAKSTGVDMVEGLKRYKELWDTDVIMKKNSI